MRKVNILLDSTTDRLSFQHYQFTDSSNENNQMNKEKKFLTMIERQLVEAVVNSCWTNAIQNPRSYNWRQDNGKSKTMNLELK